jgi:hypothetical protein
MKSFWIPLLIGSFSITGCKKKNAQERPLVSVTKATSLEAYSGKNRIALIWQIPAGEDISKCRIYYNGGDSVTVPIAPGVTSDSIIIDNLKEGAYTFFVSLLDDKGNTSGKTSVNAPVFGEKYIDALKNRSVQKLTYNAVTATIGIQWNNAGIGAVGTEVNYKDSSGEPHDLIVPMYVSKTILGKMKANRDGIIRYRTFFLPTLTAIDTFYTAYDTLAIQGDPSVTPKVLWDGDPSLGNGIWKVARNIDGDGTITIAQDSVYGNVWKFYKPAGSHRTEAHGANGFQAKEGDIIYIGWRFKLEMPTEATTNAVFQWKAYGANMKQNFPVVLKPLNGYLTLMYHNPDYQAEYPWRTPTVVDAWISIVLKMKISRDKTQGYIAFWYNGKQQTFSNGSTRYPARTLDAENCDPKWGVYGADEATVTNFVTDLKIATTYQLAAPK